MIGRRTVGVFDTSDRLCVLRDRWKPFIDPGLLEQSLPTRARSRHD